MSELVSVILPVFKDDGYLLEAVNSVLNQTYLNLELIIIANGKHNKELIAFLNENIDDKRVVLLSTDIGQLPFALNLGISYSKGEYIARMDSDDICQPERIATQINYIKEHKIDIVGSDYELIDENGIVFDYIKTHTGSEKIKKKLYVGSQFCHPSVMFKKELIVRAQGYCFGFFSEDYELWIRLMYEYQAQADNISKPLLKYRIHAEQATSSFNKKRNFAYAASLSILSILKYRKIGFLLSFFWQFKFIKKIYFFICRLFK
ncbi:glycosyltransferase [Photobacterium phosphoreum]|uniref:glycosyltransferase n=1 Tax=Photobacterium phosphoreum TaxID=659 RepID=UPI0039AF8B26